MRAQTNSVDRRLRSVGVLAPVRRLGYALVGAFLLVSSATCSEPISAPPTTVIEDVLTHNALVSGTVPITYTFEIPKNVAVQFFLQGRSGQSADSLEAIVRGPVGDIELGRVRSDGAAPSPRTNGVLIGAFPTRVRVTVEVRGVRPSDQGPFVLSASPLGAAGETEHGPDTLAIGVLRAEALDHPNDVDRFRLSLAAGDRVLLFIGKTGTTYPFPLSATVISMTTGATVHASSPFRGDHAYWERSIVLEPTIATTYSITLRAPAGALGSWSAGAYSLLPLRAARAPESAAATVARGDTIHEAIDVVGDVDEFTLNTTVRQDFRIALALERPVASPITARVLLDGAVLDSLTATDSTSDLTLFRSGRIFSDGTRTFTLQVTSATQGDRAALLTSYRLAIIPETRDPEVAAARLVSGVTVVNESIDETDDIDEFRFVMAQDQRFSARTVGDVRVYLYRQNSTLVGEIVGSQVFAPGFRSTYTAGVAPASGDYRIRVVGGSPGAKPYQLTFFAIDTLPETVPTVLPANTWITTEGLEAPADIDVFTFDVPPLGAFVRVRVERNDVFGGYITMSFRNQSYYGDPSILNRNFDVSRVGFGERPQLTVGGVSWTADLLSTGTYRVQAEFPDTRPENVAATLVFGDTVSGESITTTSDIDEFYIAGTPGQLISVWFEGPLPVCWSSQVLSLTTYDGGIVRTRQWSSYPPSRTVNVSLPRSGTLALAVQSSYPYTEACYVGAYRLLVKLAP